MANGRAKLSVIWDPGVLVEHVWRTFNFATFKVISGSFGALAIFLKYDFLNDAASILMILFQRNFL